MATEAAPVRPSALQTLFRSARFTKTRTNEDNTDAATAAAPDEPKRLSLYQLAVVLRPFFWPSAGTDGVVVNRCRAVATWVMVGASKACSILSPLYLLVAVNELVKGNKQAAFTAMVGFALLRLASSVFKECQSVLYIRVNQQASIELQELTFTHLHTLSLQWHLSKKTGNIVRVMDRGKEAANTLVTYLFLSLVPALAECAAVVILFFVQFSQWAIGLLVLGAILLYCVITVVLTLWRARFREKTNVQDNDFHYKATDSIINYETVKYFTNEAYEADRYKAAVVKFQKYNSAVQYSLSVLNISQQIILSLTLLGTALIAGQAVVDGDLTIGAWVALQAWVGNIFVPLSFLGSIYGAIVTALVDIKNLSELLSESPDVSDAPGALPIALPAHKTALKDEADAGADIEKGRLVEAASKGVSVEFRDVSFRYPSQEEGKGLSKVNIFVAAGTTTAIVGHTGAGKTTISRLLFRFYDPQEGAVLMDGKDIKAYTQRSVRSAIGVVPQDTVLFNESLLHNIRYGRTDASMEEVEAAADAAQIRSFIESLPDGWETSVGERGLKLSGGEKQRVAIARCLLKDPPVVLLDEATSALDTLTESSIQEALYALGHNRTVIIIAHRLSTVKKADQIVVLDQGAVSEVGTHEELLALEGHYHKLWSMQLKSQGSEGAEEAEEIRDGDETKEV